MAVAMVAAACSSSTSGQALRLNWYTFDDQGGGFAAAAKSCSDQSGGRYRIDIQLLPSSADQQRQQLVRRLAARDSSIDLVFTDVIWTAEFAEAGWIKPWPADVATRATAGDIKAPVQTGTYEGQLFAAPFTTNTQLLWYRKDLVPQPPQTWDQLLATADRLGPAQGGIAAQGNRYEGLSVFFNSLLASARGSILTPDGRGAALGDPARIAADTLHRIATSREIDPALSTAQEDDARLRFQTGHAAFQVNYPFIYASARKEEPDLLPNIGWAPWPRVLPDEPAHVTLGGNNLAVGAFTKHSAEAFDAAACLVQPANQKLAALNSGLPPVAESLYDDPQIKAAYPFADAMRQSIDHGSQRPSSPTYNDISLAIQKSVHPPASIDPAAAVSSMTSKVKQALKSGGLL